MKDTTGQRIPLSPWPNRFRLPFYAEDANDHDSNILVMVVMYGVTGGYRPVHWHELPKFLRQDARRLEL